MLLDLARTPLRVRYQVGWSMSSLKSRSPRCSRLGTTTLVIGVAAFSSRTAAIDMTLAVEPGSKASWTAALPRAAGSASDRSFGSKPGELAMARISPVRVSWTMTYPRSAADSFTWSLMAFWAAHWMSRSMVSSTSLPGTAGVSVEPAVGTRRPPD